MATIQTINNGETGEDVRGKINNNFDNINTELATKATQESLNTETNTRISSDVTLSGLIENETNLRINADLELSNLIDGKISTSEKDIANGVAGLDENGKISTSIIDDSTDKRFTTDIQKTRLGEWQARKKVVLLSDSSYPYSLTDTDEFIVFLFSVTDNLVVNADILTNYPNREVVLYNTSPKNRVIKDSNSTVFVLKPYSVAVIKYVAGSGVIRVSVAPYGSTNSMLDENDIVNNLSTGGTEKVLSAEQGKVLKQEINAEVHVNRATLNNVSGVKTPLSNATGTVGEIAWDSNYIYVCTATNTWKRALLSTY